MITFYKKIYFLKMSGSSLEIYYNFIKTKLLSILNKKKIKFYKRTHQKLIKNKAFTNDFFSSHAYYFFKILTKLKTNFKYLEIGSYEGNSTLFFASNFPECEITCVDPWIKTSEYSKDINFIDIENNFYKNISKYQNIKKIKSTSDQFFLKNKNFYDIIYVDGYHDGSQVYKDVCNAWEILNKNGYLICDDYIWNIEGQIEKLPCKAINIFLSKIKNEYRIIFISSSQIFIKKI